MIYYHQLDPFIIQFTGNFGLRWYSMAYILAIMFSYFLAKYLIKKQRIHLPLNKLSDIIFFGALGAVLGGRIGFCIFYSPDLLLSFDSSFPFWGVLKIHQGGMSSHGGILGLLTSLFFYSYRYQISLYTMLDLASITGAFGIFLGRIANFINAELYGRIVEGKAWFSVRFPTELFLWSSDPKFYKKELLSLESLLPYLKSSLIEIPSSNTWSDWLNRIGEGDEGMVYERYISYICNSIYNLSHSSPIKELLEPLLSLRHPSQLYQAIGGGLIPFILICIFWLKPRKPGFISVVFILSYLFFRIFTEFYRQPDTSIGFQLFDLTRGQWLSLMMYILAFLFSYCVFTNKNPLNFFKKLS
ncbi:MAG: prolipoprotein diacylglyceryl transferase [Bdellovibrionales bacterium]|nr:prolipoprotein diacylglyceryl transferase [Bdellovibrionales bacterium]